MRVHPRRKSPPEEWRRRLGGLDHLPLRPATARLLVGSLADESSDDDLDPVESPKIQTAIGLDPGWILARSSVRSADQSAGIDRLTGLVAENGLVRSGRGTARQALAPFCRRRDCGSGPGS